MMQHLIVSAIGFFGRYTAIVVFAVACALVVLWLRILDSYPITFALSAVLVVPAFMASCALLVGLLFSGVGKREGEFLPREAAPRLWRIWDEVGGHDRHRRQLVIDPNLNAWISERRRIMGLWGHEVTLGVGLPLLLCLDLPALRSVIAHEIGHNELRHTSGSANIAEFEGTFATLFEYVHPERTVTGAIIYALLGQLGPWLEKEHLRLARRHEFEADHIAAEREGKTGAASTLVLVAGCVEFLEHEILEPINEELRGATSAPLPPLQRLIDRLDEIRQPDMIVNYAKRRWNEESDPQSTHPTLRERLSALGIAELPSIGPLGQPAADLLLPPDTKARLIQLFIDEWRCEAEAMVCLE